MVLGDYYYAISIKQLVDGKDTGLRMPLMGCNPNVYSPLSDSRLDILRLKYKLRTPAPSTLIPYNSNPARFVRILREAMFAFDQNSLRAQNNQSCWVTKYAANKNCFFLKKQSMEFKFLTSETFPFKKVNLAGNVESFVGPSESILSNPLFFSALGGVVIGVSLSILHAIYDGRLHYKWPACHWNYLAHAFMILIFPAFLFSQITLLKREIHKEPQKGYITIFPAFSLFQKDYIPIFPAFLLLACGDFEQTFNTPAVKKKGRTKKKVQEVVLMPSNKKRKKQSYRP
jgi:hypothetical protein